MIGLVLMTRLYCNICEKPLKTCLCSFIKKINNLNDVLIFQHVSEKKHALGTAKILSLSLKNSSLYVGEDFKDNLINSALSSDDKKNYLLFPTNEAVSIETLSLEERRQMRLIVVDGTWRKSKLLLHKNPLLKNLPSLKLNPNKTSRYTIRKQPFSGALSTLEAVYETLCFLEQDDEKFLPLIEAFDKMIENQIQKIPKDTFQKNYKKNK